MTYSIEYRVNGPHDPSNDSMWIESAVNITTLDEAEELASKHTLTVRIVNEETGRIER